MKMYVYHDNPVLHVAIPKYGNLYRYYIRISSGIEYFMDTTLDRLKFNLEVELPSDFNTDKVYTHEEIMVLLPVEFSL